MNNQYLPPMYVQIKELLKKRIASGDYKRGEKLPSERELSQHYDISRMTARKALTELVNDGLAYRTHGSGTYVAHLKIERDMTTLTGFSQMLRDKGITPSNRLIKTGHIEADKKLSEIFNVMLGTIFYEIVRVRYGNDVPLALEFTYVPENLFPGLLEEDFSSVSLYSVFETKYNHKVSHAKEWLSLYQVHGDVAKYLDIPDETSVMLFECITFDEDSVPVEFARSYSRGDQCVFYTEMRK